MAEAKDTAPSPANSTDSNDQEFILTAEMMVDGEDYEATIDEEEDLEDEDEDDDELEDLQKEGEIPIEELLAMYYNGTSNGNGENVPQESQDGTSSSKEFGALTKNEENSNQSSLSDAQTGTGSQDETDPFQNQRITRGLAALNSQYFVEEEYSSDEDYQPGAAADDWKKEIQIGEDYQAEVDDSISPYLPSEKTKDFEDKLLWTPHVVNSEQLSSYLDLVYKLTEFGSQQSNRDDEQALFTLLQTKDINAALKKRQEQERQPPDVSLWSEEECQNFEQGLRVFGKDFRLIQKNKVQTRTVGEIVQFYYLWKKTERHDAFVTQTKLGRKKYTLPGIADIMGRFMEENESMFSSRSVSPSNEVDHYHRAAQGVKEIKKELVDYNTGTTTTAAATENIYNNTPTIHIKNANGSGGGGGGAGHTYHKTTKTMGRDLANRVNSTTPDDSWRSSAVTTSIPIGTTN